MSTIKKAFAPIVSLLEANKNKTVSAILPQVIELASAKTAGGVASASHKDANGNVVAIRCSYFGLWFPVSHVEFGKKEGTATGYNSMCKEGANRFSEASRIFKQGKERVLDQLVAGEIDQETAKAELAKLEENRLKRPPFSIEGMGWETLEECLKQTPAQLDKLVAAHKAKLEAEAKAAADKAKAEAEAKAKADKAAKAAPATAGAKL